MEASKPSKTALITEINGPVVKARGASGLSMNEIVYIGPERLVGETIELRRELATIQVYEDTTGLKPGIEVHGQGLPLFVELGPGIVGHSFDGIQRPLSMLYERSGPFIQRGASGHALDREKPWSFTPEAAEGDHIEPGRVIGRTQETDSVAHKIMAPPGVGGRVREIAPQGVYTLEDKIAVVEDERGGSHDIRLYQRWPVRRSRPCLERLPCAEPLFTGQRVFDFFFPLAKGGTAAIPGGFGAGKTVMQHQLSKWADADIIVYIGCGERGNEMAGILKDFPRLLDPRTERPLVEKTVFIANTSDMPVAAREASIYTGITVAEYYRDMGYDVALMADSTSRWAEALREISGRLEEMPTEEGFPAYLASRLAGFYERGGVVTTLCGEKGSVSLIGAVSPPGSDFSEPVTQHTKRYVSAFWALNKELASARYFPAIDYLSSYSGYVDSVSEWWDRQAGLVWTDFRSKALEILKEDSKLANIVKLIGEDALPDDQKVVYEAAKVIKSVFLQQSALDPVDTYCPAGKQVFMIRIILKLFDRMKEAVSSRIPVYRMLELPVFEEIQRMKYTYGGDDPQPFETILHRVDEEFDDLLHKEI